MLDEDRYLAQICGLAANPSLPQPLLDRLVTAASGERSDSGVLAHFIAMADREPMRLPTPLETSAPQDSRTGLTAPDCSPELLNHIATTAAPDSSGLVDVAKHPNTSADTLKLCLNHPVARRHAARHPNLPPHVITDLLDDPDLLVAEAAAANPALPRKIMEALLT